MVTASIFSYEPGDWSVYVVRDSNGPRTYIGATNNICRRFRQHHYKLKAGAKTTRAFHGRALLMGFIIGLSKRQALHLEWKAKRVRKSLDRFENLLIAYQRMFGDSNNKVITISSTSDNMTTVGVLPAIIKVNI